MSTTNPDEIQPMDPEDSTINDQASCEEQYFDLVDKDKWSGREVSDSKMSVCEDSFKLLFENDSFEQFTSYSFDEKRKESGKEKEDLESILNDKSAPRNSSKTEESIKNSNDLFDELIQKGIRSYKAAMLQHQEKQKDPVATIDADSKLVLPEQNDTKIKQEAHDGPMEEIPLNENANEK